MAHQHKAMKGCMAKHASSNDLKTKDEMQTACKEEMKSKEDNSSTMSNTRQQ
jgi:hypothetical protein